MKRDWDKVRGEDKVWKHGALPASQDGWVAEVIASGMNKEISRERFIAGNIMVTKCPLGMKEVKSIRQAYLDSLSRMTIRMKNLTMRPGMSFENFAAINKLS